MLDVQYNKATQIYHIQWEKLEKTKPELTDYSIERKHISLVRELEFVTDWTPRAFKAFVKRHPDACLYRSLSHNPQLAEGDDFEEVIQEQRITFDGIPYVDPFGLFVYSKTNISWKKAEDVDLRFPSGIYLYRYLEPELEFLYRYPYTQL